MESTLSAIRNRELIDWRMKTVNELRALAAILEATDLKDFPTPSISVSIFSKPQPSDDDIYNEPDITQADVRFAMIASPGGWHKNSGSDYISYTKRLGEHLAVRFHVGRGQVCTRVQTGTKIQPAQPERVVPVYEWRCDEPELEV